MGYKKRVNSDELQRRLGVTWPPAHRFATRYGYGSALIRDPDNSQKWTVSEETADAVVAAFKEERDEAWRASRGRGVSR